MSWSLQIPATHFDDVEDAVLAAQPTGQDINDTHVYKAVKTAKECALHLIGSGALGDETKQYVISMGGHANVGHEPADKWVNDTVQVSVHQA